MKTSRSKPTLWTTGELAIMTITGFIIGITVCILFWPSTTVITDHEVIVSNFLGHKELMVIKVKN
jgi:hypothetical protein